jgi:phosphoribosylformylglycinamidine synthase I
MKAAVIIFPGTNCDRETRKALELSGFQVDYVWHEWDSINKYNLVVLPGGFSYGDYLRPGAIARFSPVMKSVEKYTIEKQGIILGICNGFQILLEAGLLPGAMMKNDVGHFICKTVKLNVEPTKVFYKTKREVELYIAHSDGKYVADPKTVEELEKNGQILMKYVDNPNGSVHSIASIANVTFNVIGMMPHPERSSMKYHKNLDGLEIFNALKEYIHACDR